MQYRKLGRRDLKISAIGLGTMTWGFQNTQAEGFEQTDYALERGINFFDTAEMYAIPPTEKIFGTTETIISFRVRSRIVASQFKAKGRSSQGAAHPTKTVLGKL